MAIDKQQPVEVRRNASSAVAMVIASGIFGFIGGWLAVQSDSSRSFINSSTAQQIVSSESDAIVNVADMVSPSVVSINVTSEEVSNSVFFGNQVFESESEGSGIIVTESGIVVTNKHVIPDSATTVSVVLYDGTVFDDVEVLGRDPFNDVAFLKINDGENLVPAKLGNSDEVRVGERVIAIGNALGEFDTTVTSGIISGLSRPLIAGDGNSAEQLQDLFQTDTAINPGNSGGPLVNINGEVIGINTAVAGGAENIGFAIPINQVIPAIKSVEENGKLVRPYLGVRYILLNEQIAEEESLEVSEGAYITASPGQTAIVSDGPAAKAGLQEGDVITKVNDKEINQDNALVTVVSQYAVGEIISLTIIRNGAEQVLELTLEAAPQQ